MKSGSKQASTLKRPTTSSNQGENASRLANKTIPEEPAKEDRQTTYSNSLDQNGQHTSKFYILISNVLDNN